jgi:hypothetical protein
MFQLSYEKDIRRIYGESSITTLLNLLQADQGTRK